MSPTNNDIDASMNRFSMQRLRPKNATSNLQKSNTAAAAVEAMANCNLCRENINVTELLRGTDTQAMIHMKHRYKNEEQDLSRRVDLLSTLEKYEIKDTRRQQDRVRLKKNPYGDLAPELEEYTISNRLKQ